MTPAEDVICNGETTSIVLRSDVTDITWTWTANPSPEISGASADNSGTLSSINQTLTNSDNSVHNVVYNITPRVYGQCDLPLVHAEVWVNPTPQIQVNPVESVICYGETVTLSVTNPNTTVRGQWLYDLASNS